MGMLVPSWHSMGSAHRTVLPILGTGLPTSINSSWRLPHEHAQRFTSVKVLDLIKIEPHKWDSC